MSKDAWTENQVVGRIGDTATLAEAASTEYARRGFSGRHPIVMFLMAPIPMAILGWIVVFAVGVGCFAGIRMAGRWSGAESFLSENLDQWPAAAVWGIAVLLALAAVVPPAVLAVLFCRLANRNGLSWRWALAPCALVAVAAGMFQATMDLPGTTGDGRLMLGMGVWIFPPVRQVLQFALPLTIGLGLIWRQTRLAAKESGQKPQAVERLRTAA